MSEDNTKLELARRAVTCKHWRWMPGARDLSSEFGPRRILAVLADGTQILSAHETIGAFPEQTTVRPVAAFTLPDLDDPATLGCIENGLLVAAWGHRLNIYHDGGTGPVPWRSWHWDVSEDDYEEVGTRSATKAEALVAALEAAP